MKLKAILLSLIFFMPFKGFSFEFLEKMGIKGKAAITLAAVALVAYEAKKYWNQIDFSPKKKSPSLDLIQAAKDGNLTALETLVINPDIDLDFQDPDGNTALMHATAQLIKIFEMLAIVDIQEQIDKALLQKPIKSIDIDAEKITLKQTMIKYLDAIDILLDAGASLESVRNNQKETAYTLLFPAIAQINEYLSHIKNHFSEEDFQILQKINDINSNYLFSTKVVINKLIQSFWFNK